MTIKEVEERTSLSRSNVRFYEKEKLIELFQEMKVMVIEIILKMMWKI